MTPPVAIVVKLWRSHLAREHHNALDDLQRFNGPIELELYLAEELERESQEEVRDAA